MPLNHQDVTRIAHLARLRLTDTELAQVVADLDRIVRMVASIEAADTQGVEPMASPLDTIQPLRPDAVTEPNQRDRLQQLAPLTKTGLYLVPKVID